MKYFSIFNVRICNKKNININLKVKMSEVNLRELKVLKKQLMEKTQAISALNLNLQQKIAFNEQLKHQNEEYMKECENKNKYILKNETMFKIKLQEKDELLQNLNAKILAMNEKMNVLGDDRKQERDENENESKNYMSISLMNKTREQMEYDFLKRLENEKELLVKNHRQEIRELQQTMRVNGGGKKKRFQSLFSCCNSNRNNHQSEMVSNSADYLLLKEQQQLSQ